MPGLPPQAPFPFDGDGDRLLPHLAVLPYLDAVAARGGIAGAADLLNRAPTSLSRGIAELEKSLGVALLERRRGSSVPTTSGERLLIRARRVDAEIAAAETDVARRGDVSRAGLRHLLRDGRKLLMLLRFAEAGTISGAAKHLSLSQAGASLALGRAEAALGAALFHRTARGVAPTEMGLRLIVRAQRIRAEMRHAAADLAELAGSPAGTIVIGALPMARSELLPKVIGDLLALHPRLSVQVVEAQRDALLAKLRSGEVDALVAVQAPEFDAGDLVVEPLFDDQLGVVAAPGHPLAAMPSVSPSALAAARWILPWRGAVARTLFEARFGEHGIQPPPAALETGDLLVMRPLLARGEMLAFTSLGLVRSDLAAGTFVQVATDLGHIARRVVLLTRVAASLPTSVQAMLGQLRAAASSLGEHQPAG